MFASASLSETEETRVFVQPTQGERLPSLLKRCLPQIQTKRAYAYNRLETALRSFARHPSSRPSPPAPRHEDYATVCANVTEDLKLCNEAVLELRSVVSTYGRAQEDDITTVVKWLDHLQQLEQTKFLATVSKHALSRSSIVRESHGGEDLKAKAAKYARHLNDVNCSVNDLLEEMREYFLEGDGEER